MAYTPGVAEPCRRIAENEDDVYKYTAKGNLVAVVSNGTAVLGLGDIGPLPVQAAALAELEMLFRFMVTLADNPRFSVPADMHTASAMANPSAPWA